MKKIIILFFLLTSLAFAIPDFKDLKWGFSIETIESFYPKVKKKFTTTN